MFHGARLQAEFRPAYPVNLAQSADCRRPRCRPPASRAVLMVTPWEGNGVRRVVRKGLRLHGATIERPAGRRW
jgi:hypothetical protein